MYILSLIDMGKKKTCPSCGSKMALITEISSREKQYWLCYGCLNTKVEELECEHDFVIYKINYQRHDNDFHVVTKCSKCGQHHKTHKKKDFDLATLPEYDIKAEEIRRREYFDEWQRKTTILHKKKEEARIALKKRTNAWNIQQWYYSYLESSMWHKKREWILSRAERKCERCGSEDEQLYVHHKTYERVGYEEPGDLIAVCKKCHGTLHGENPNLDIVSQFRLHED